MFDFLDTLRAKPEQERRFIAFGFAGGVTILIIGIWLFTFFSTGDRGVVITTTTQESSWKNLVEDIQGQILSIKEAARGLF